MPRALDHTKGAPIAKGVFVPKVRDGYSPPLPSSSFFFFFSFFIALSLFINNFLKKKEKRKQNIVPNGFKTSTQLEYNFFFILYKYDIIST